MDPKFGDYQEPFQNNATKYLRLKGEFTIKRQLEVELEVFDSYMFLAGIPLFAISNSQSSVAKC